MNLDDDRELALQIPPLIPSAQFREMDKELCSYFFPPSLLASFRLSEKMEIENRRFAYKVNLLLEDQLYRQISAWF